MTPPESRVSGVGNLSGLAWHATTTPTKLLPSHQGGPSLSRPHDVPPRGNVLVTAEMVQVEVTDIRRRQSVVA